MEVLGPKKIGAFQAGFLGSSELGVWDCSLLLGGSWALITPNLSLLITSGLFSAVTIRVISTLNLQVGFGFTAKSLNQALETRPPELLGPRKGKPVTTSPEIPKL